MPLVRKRNTFSPRVFSTALRIVSAAQTNHLFAFLSEPEAISYFGQTVMFRPSSRQNNSARKHLCSVSCKFDCFNFNDFPIEFVSFVRSHTRSDLYTKGSTSHSWTEMTKEKVLSRYEQVQTFEGGKFPNQALPDGTKVCSSMKYKIINANSCDRTWVKKRQTWSEAQESFSELQKACGILEMAMEKKPALVTVGIGGNLVTEETVWSWVDQEEIRKVEDEDSVLQGNVYIYSSLTLGL